LAPQWNQSVQLCADKKDVAEIQPLYVVRISATTVQEAFFGNRLIPISFSFSFSFFLQIQIFLGWTGVTTWN
jgi:hypothetical protein